MAREKAAVDVMDAEAHPPVLAVRLGRGRTGGTTGLDWLIQRARNQGREMIVADGDRRNSTLAALHPGALQPETDETADVKDWITTVLNRMAEDGRSVALDLGGGDRVLAEYGRDLGLVEFCEAVGALPLALYFLGPETADFEHVQSIWKAGYFNPKRSILVMNENLVPAGKTAAGAFQPIVGTPEFERMVRAGARAIYMPRLPCLDTLRSFGVGFYDQPLSLDGPTLDPVRRFMVRRWLEHMERQLADAGVVEWLP